MSAATIFSKSIKDPAWTTYACEVQITNRLTGGIPKDPDMIKGALSRWVSQCRARCTPQRRLAAPLRHA